MTGATLGNWVLGEEIGRGPLGTVYRAADAHDPSRAAAVKVLTHPAALAPEVVARFPGEILALHRLTHPNVARFFDAGVHAGAPWYASELVDGTDCATLLKTRPRAAGGPPGLDWAGQVVGVFAQVARALKHGHHRSILHRGLKPSNVLVRPDGSVKVTDFGVTRALALPPAALPPDPWGTAGYLAPEHFTGKPLTRRSDLYALGGVAYTLIAGRPPFAAATTAEFMHKHCYALPDRPALFAPDLPAELDELVCELLAKDPSRRPGSAAAVIEELDRVRGKQERKGRAVAWPADLAEKSELVPALPDVGVPEPAPARPLLSRPAVVVPLFLAVLGLTLFLLFRPGPSADDLMAPARPLLASDDPADWERAWDEYLEPLSRKFPDQYADEVAATRARVDARRELRRAVEQGRLVRYRSEAERLFYHGLRLAQAGEAAAARRTWEALSTGFAGVEAEKGWVRLAAVGLAELDRKPPSAPDRAGLTAALDRVKALPPAEKASALAALDELYRSDPAALESIRAAK
ncbi:MAG: serine/threonine-protein kinase [Gemmataceae bacterium]